MSRGLRQAVQEKRIFLAVSFPSQEDRETMSGGTDLRLLVASAAPVLAPGDYVFVTVRDFGEIGRLDPIGVFREGEAVTVICARDRAEDAGLRIEGIYRQITLQVHSSLEAVGFLATIATALAAAYIPCNAVAAYYHDHLFVPADKAKQAMAVLAALPQKECSPNDTPERTARRWMEEIWRRRELALFDEIHAPHFIDRSAAGRGTDRASYKEGVAELFAAFPDWEAEIDDLLVEPATGKVALRWTAHGTQQGSFMGRAASGRRVTFRGIEFVRIEGNQIVERWGEWDGIDLLDQLGET